MNEVKPCRHEYVRIYQRKLKGLDRRLVSTRAYLPVGFKQTDLTHLSEGSYCFCTTCRARLFPRRTTAEKAAARIVNMQVKAGLNLAALAEADLEGVTLQQLSEAAEMSNESDAGSESDPLADKAIDVHVEELELESVDVQDIEAEGVKIVDEDAADCLSGDEDI
jgi:hypothetical protein